MFQNKGLILIVLHSLKGVEAQISNSIQGWSFLKGPNKQQAAAIAKKEFDISIDGYNHML